MRRAIPPRVGRWVWLATVLLVASGCAGPRNEIFSVAPPASVVALDDPIYFGGKLLSTTPRAGDLVYITLPGPNAREFHLIGRDPAGALVRETALPAYYVDPSHSFVALSPDAKVLAYLRTDGNLCTYDLDTRVESVLLTGVGDDAFLGGLAWIDAKHLVLVLDRGSNAPDRILTVDAAARRIVATREIEDPNHFAVSASGRRLAVTQMVRGSGMEILDLPALSRVEQIQNDNPRSWMGLVAWNPSATQLAYLDADSWLSVLTLGAGPPVRIAKIPDAHVCYFLAFPSDEQLVYECGPPFGSPAAAPDEEHVSFLDLASRRVTAEIAAEQISSCIVVGGNDLIACEVCGSVEVRSPRE